MTHRGPFQPLLFCVILCDFILEFTNRSADCKAWISLLPCSALPRNSWISVSDLRHLRWICSKFRGEQQGSLQVTACQETLKEAELLRTTRRLRGDTIIFRYERMLKRKRKKFVLLVHHRRNFR